MESNGTPAQFSPIVLSSHEVIELLAFFDEVTNADPASILAFEADALRFMIISKLEG